MKITRLLAAALLVALSAAAGPVHAHPHIWVEGRTTLVMEAGQLTALRLEWTFDDVFSEFMVAEHPAQPDGSFTPANAAAVEALGFATLAESGWLTRLEAGGVPVELGQPLHFTPSLADGLLTYRFTLPLRQPLDPSLQPVRFGVYDESFYIDVAPAALDAVRIEGALPTACTTATAEDATKKIYFGLLSPLVTTIECAGS